MRIGYYPGCSLHSSSKEFDESLRAIVGALDVELAEIADWACCGASSAHATHHLLSVALPARTLAQAEAEKHDKMLAPCAACYSRLAGAHHALAHDPKLAERVGRVLQRPFHNSVDVLSIVELLRDLVPTIQSKVTRPLKDLKVACYYGCLLVRPPEVRPFDDAESPSSMEKVVQAAGATAVSWNKRLDCCGGGFSLARTGSVVRLGRAILEDAQASGAQAIVVACPMCQSNLDMRQKAMSQGRTNPVDLPILFITQLVGLALGLPPKTLGLDRHFVSTQAVATHTAQALPAHKEQA